MLSILFFLIRDISFVILVGGLGFFPKSLIQNLLKQSESVIFCNR